MREKGEGVQKVHIKFERLQTWLFAVPRLRAMVGANTLLGEIARDELKALAFQQGKGWQLQPITGVLPALDLQDPLETVDDPGKDLEKGILSRDGGHFEAYFREGAKAFADHASALLRCRLPGMRFSVQIDKEKQTLACATLSAELPVLTRCQWGPVTDSPRFKPAKVTIGFGLRSKCRLDMQLPNEPKTSRRATWQPCF